jgi:lipopolysaccharide export system permease protein
VTILDRYIIRHFFGPFMLSVGGFAIIGIIDILFYLIELSVISGISMAVVIRLLLYKLPAIMILFFPMAMLFSVMLVLVRMAKDNELTVLRTSGVSSIRILAPLLVSMVLITIASYLLNDRVVPWTNRVSDAVIRDQIKRKPPPVISENVVFKGTDGRHFYIKTVNTKEKTMESVLIFEETNEFPRVISAKTAVWNDLKWMLMDGYLMAFDQAGSMTYSDHFDEMTIAMQQGFSHTYNQKTAREMDSKTLKTKIDMLNKGGISTRGLSVEYYMKTSIPVACFVFGLMGVAFCFQFVRSGKDWWGVIIAIIIAVLSTGLYFFGIALFRALGKDGTIAPLISVWIPNIVYTTLSSLIIG